MSAIMDVSLVRVWKMKKKRMIINCEKRNTQEVVTLKRKQIEEAFIFCKETIYRMLSIKRVPLSNVFGMFHNSFWIFVCYLLLNNNKSYAAPVVYLTVSSVISSRSESRQLELNWFGLENRTTYDDDYIRLYSHEPDHNDTDYLASYPPRSKVEGHFKTSIRFPEQFFDPANLTNACLGFWVAYVLNESVITVNCIRAQPNWMYEIKDSIGNFRLSDLVIPGTHNAGCYNTFSSKDDTILNRYLITQEESIWNQLVYGIRYLDLRVSYERIAGTQDRFWITHSYFTTEISVKSALSQVKNFLNTTNEIVILDFHRFVNGFNGRRARQKHRLLIQLLEKELSDYMIPVSATLDVTLKELWNTNKRLLVGYASNTERSRSIYLYPAVKHLWADKDNIRGLFNYLNETICDQTRPTLYSAMAQLTPTTSGTIFDIYGGLRKMAYDVNHDITKWLRELWSTCANIVATDFFMGNNVIETAIELNKIKIL